jgi:hypothetical protein
VGMNLRDSNQSSGDGKYISKRVMVNGQFVTLYSANGQTWVSSPEEIPSLMERLENARITLTSGEKPQEGDAQPAAKPVETKEKQEASPAAPKVLQTKYRMKGPKPRPILRQGGKVIEGTPIEPVSASSTTVSFSSEDGEVMRIHPPMEPLKRSHKTESTGTRKKLIAPLSPKVLKAKAAAEAKSAATKALAAKSKKIVEVKGKAQPKDSAPRAHAAVQSKAKVAKSVVAKPAAQKAKGKTTAKSAKKAAPARKAQAKAARSSKSTKPAAKAKSKKAKSSKR